MNKYMLIFYEDVEKLAKLSPTELQTISQSWMTWIGSLDQRGMLENRGERLEPRAKFISGRKKLISDGPYTEAKDAVGGFSLLKAKSFEEAVEIAKECPIYSYDGGT